MLLGNQQQRELSESHAWVYETYPKQTEAENEFDQEWAD